MILKKTLRRGSKSLVPGSPLQFIAAGMPCTYANSFGSRFPGNSHLTIGESGQLKNQRLTRFQQSCRIRPTLASNFLRIKGLKMTG